MKKCLILVNAYSRLKSSLNQSERLRQEFALMGVSAEIRPNNFFACTVEEGGILKNTVGEYDFCVYLDKDKYIARMLEKCGMRLFNRARSIEDCDDKMLTSVALAGSGVPMPLTLPGLLCYTPDAAVDDGALDEVERRLGYPMIVKESYGSLGAGVFKVENRAQLRAAAQRVKCSPHLFQRFVGESAGTDARVIVVGGRVVAAMRRTSSGDFRSNLELGGVGSPLEPDGDLSAICLKAAAALGLDYCGVDVLFGARRYTVCEVNSNAFFGGIEGVTGINVARAYARHMYETIYNQGER